MRCAAIGLTVVLALLSRGAMAAEYKAGSLEIIAPWSRATPKGAATAIGYMTIKNGGTTPDRLIGGTAEVAKEFQLHSMVMQNSVAKMRELKAVDIAPGQTVEFKPGGSHVMFVGLNHPLHEGEHIKDMLTFEHAGTVQIEYDVQGIGAQAPPEEMQHMSH